MPKTEEKLRQLLVRALDLGEWPELAQSLSGRLWERLHVWEEQKQEDALYVAHLVEFSDLPASERERYDELRGRSEGLHAFLELQYDFLERIDDLKGKVDHDLDRWTTRVMLRDDGRASETPPPAGKPPVGAGCGEPGSGSREVA